MWRPSLVSTHSPATPGPITSDNPYLSSAALPLGAGVIAKTAGEQPIAIGVMSRHALAPASGADRPRHHIAPHREIVAGIADHRGLAGRARGRVNPRQLILGHSKKAERIVGSEIRLRGEGKALQILEGAEIIGMCAMLIELGAHRWDGLVDTPQRDADPARLHTGNLVAASRLHPIDQTLA